MLAVHSRLDEWVDHDGQVEFLDRLRATVSHPDWIEMMSLDETGTPHEHLGFGRRATT